MTKTRESTIVEIAGHKMAILPVDLTSTGRPIIFLHGITSSVFDRLGDTVSLVKANGPYTAISLPGHFPAVFPPDFHEFELTAQTIANLIADAIQIATDGEPATLIGHSTGGFAALAVAIHRPELVRRVVSVSGFAEGKWIGALGMYQRWIRSGALGKSAFKALYRMAHNPSVFQASLRIYAADVPAMLHHPAFKTTVTACLPAFQQLDLDAMSMYFKMMPEIDITPLLNQIRVPVLALAGDCDGTVPPRQSRLIAENVQRGSLALLPGAGHTPHFERSVEYARSLTEWLAKTDRQD